MIPTILVVILFYAGGFDYEIGPVPGNLICEEVARDEKELHLTDPKIKFVETFCVYPGDEI